MANFHPSHLFTLLCAASATAQGSWSNPLPQTGRPTARQSLHQTTYDRANDRLVLFGGDPGAGGSYRSETYLMSCATNAWTLGPAGPSARAYHSLTYDAARQRVILFGGHLTNPSGPLTDQTWSFDGTSWTQLTSATRPSPRNGHTAVFDSVRNCIVLFGGVDTASELHDTWEWDGSRWWARSSSFPAVGRHNAHGAFDPIRGRTVLFGGRDNSSPPAFYDGTFEWDGATWSNRAPAVRPLGRAGGVMCYDEAMDRVVLHSGNSSSGLLSDTWYWDGSTWENHTHGNAPAPRTCAGMVYDPIRARLLLFGGGEATARSNNLWAFAPAIPAAYRTFGSGCPGNGQAPTLTLADHRLPWVGGNYGIRIGNAPQPGSLILVTGFSRQTWNGAPLPASLQPFGAPNCFLLVSPDLMEVQFHAGNPVLTRSVPATVSLAGFALHHQVAVYAPNANALQMLASNAGEAAIGLR